MTNEPEKQTRELASADLDHVVAAGGAKLADFQFVKTLDDASTAGAHSSGGGGGAGKVSMRDFSFVAKVAR